jgi:hypothetical protein
VALNPKTNAASRNLALNAAFDTLNSGSLRIADGTQPTDADTALGAQVDLADLTFGSTAFAAASAASKAANAITQDSSANASSTATWATLQASGVAFSGSNARVMDMSVGTSSANLNLNSVAISSGAAVSVSSLTITQAA